MASASTDETQICHPVGDKIDLGDEKSDLNATSIRVKEENLNEINKIYRESDNVYERPASLRLESVLEYANRIKTFLGLEDEQKDGSSVADDNTHQGENTRNKMDSDEDESSVKKNNSSKKSQMDLTPVNNLLNNSTLTLQPLPDIIGIQPDTFEEGEQFPDILGQGKNTKIERLENSADLDSSEINNVITSSAYNNAENDLKDNISNEKFPENNVADHGEEPLSKNEYKSSIDVNGGKEAEVSDTSGSRDEKDITQNDESPSFQDMTHKESVNKQGISSSEEKSVQINGCDEPEINKEEEESDDESPYQITHIEEGLRQAEKSLKSNLPKKICEQETMPQDALQDAFIQQAMPKLESQKPDEQTTKVNDFQELEEQTKLESNSNEPDEQQTMVEEESNQKKTAKKDVPEAEGDEKELEQQTKLKNDSRESDEPQTTAPEELKEEQTIRKDVPEEESDAKKSDTNPPVLLKRRSKLSMEDIRRLSTEVVNSVLQTAGDEVIVILQNRNSFTEGDKPLDKTDIEPLDDSEISMYLQNAEVQFHSGKFEEVSLADIPEEKPSRTFSNTTDVSRESVATSGTIRSIPIGSKHSIDRIEVTDEIDIDTQCGIGPFKPQCIQRFATANVYVILYSIIGILHGSYYTYLVGVLTTLEKRFEFKSKTSGFIMMLDELTPLFLGVLVGHYGGRAHRPRLLSFGMFLSAFCCFASALPYFLYGTATHLSAIDNVYNITSTEMCNGDDRVEHCDEDDRPPTVTAILLLMLGSFLKGFGNLAYYAIGLAYLDDNAKKKNTPLYFAVAFALRLLGPMVGFLMSSAFLKYYENPLVTPDFGPDDPRWIGGWWMGFVLQGILLLIFAGPLALFPRRLPDHAPLLHEIEQYSNANMFDGLGASLKRLARNPLFILINLNAIFTVYGNFGYYIMLPKYMENQFRLSASSASLFAGPPGIAALMVSCVIGGYLIWKFKPTAKFLAGGLVTLELISTVGYLILMIPQCEKVELTHFGLGDESLILENSCNGNCSCSTVQFTPVCGPDGKSYFSPCYAGCTYQQDQSFYNCSCVDGASTVTKGLCTSENCWSQALAYIVTLPVLQFVVNILRVAYTMIMLRSIKPEDKNIALGVFETFLSTIAFIPFPVLYGALVDSACLVWEKSCGETGNCWFYDIQKFSYLMHGGSAFFCGLSTLNLIAIFFLINRIKDLYKDEEEEPEDNTRKATNNLKQ